MDTEYLTAEEVAECLLLPLSTVKKLVQEKKLSGFEVGKDWRFCREAIQGWLNQQDDQNKSSKINSDESYVYLLRA